MITDFKNGFDASSMLTEYGMNSGDEIYDANYTRDIFISSLANESLEGIYLWGFKTYNADSTGINNKCFMTHDYKLKPAVYIR